MQIPGVRVAFALIAMADLQNQLAVLRELQELIVRYRFEARQPIRWAGISAEPHEALVVDVNPVLSFGPFVSIAGAAPGFDVIPCCVENDYGRRSHFRLLRLERPRTVQQPDVVLGIDCKARGIAELPLRRHLRPRAIHFKGRQTAGRRLRGDCRHRKPPRSHNRDSENDSN